MCKSWIQDFEADFPQKLSLKMLNSAHYSNISDLFTVYLPAKGNRPFKFEITCINIL